MLFSCRELIRGYNKFLFVLFLPSACHVELNFLQQFNFENRNFLCFAKTYFAVVLEYFFVSEDLFLQISSSLSSSFGFRSGVGTFVEIYIHTYIQTYFG